MMKKLRYFCTLLLMAVASVAWAEDELAYTLQPASGTNNSYAGNCDIAIDGITWNLTGNSTMQPWRIGGKSLSDENRTLYSKTAIDDNITKIEVTHGAANNITINSWTLVVASDANFSTVVSTLTPTFTASETTTITRPDGVDWSGCYYKFIYNVTVSGSSNRFVEFTQAKFYKAAASGDAPSISADNVNIAYDATGGEIAYELTNPVTGGSMSAEVTVGDWLELSGTSFASPIAFTCSANDGAERTATVTLTYSYDNQSVTKNVTVTQAGNPNRPGTENNPYTVAQAIQAIDDANQGTVSDVYVAGIVSQVDSYNNGQITYWISDDGTTTNQFEVYRGKGIGGANFTSQNDVKVGDEVVVKGNITYYVNGGVYEFAANNQLVSLNRPTPTDPTVTVNQTSVEVDAAEHDGTITVTCENMGENLDISVFFCEKTDVTTPAEYDWITADIDNNNDVYYIIEANTATEARTAYMVVKVADADAKEVYTSNLITFTQAGKELPSVTWDLTTDSYSSASEDLVTWTSDFATMKNAKGGSTTAANNYLGGTNNHTRFYKNQKITFTPKSGYAVTSIVINAISGYVNGFNGENAWTNATVSVNGTVITVTPTNINLPVSVTISAACRATGVTVSYVESDVVAITIKEGFTATTFSCDKALDFTNVTGAEAFIITDENGTTQKVTKVPAGEGLYIVGTEGNYEVPFLVNESEAGDVTGNLLVGTISEPVNTKTLEGNYTYYLFGKQNGKEAFFKVGESTSEAKATASAGKAYLAVPGAGNAKEMIVIGGDVTGIESIENGTIVNDNYYTIDGKLVKGQPTQKGIYVVNGRKVVIK